MPTERLTSPDMEVTLDQAREVLAAQPFSTLLGAELTAFDETGAELRVPLRAEHLQQHGFVHGGVLLYAADNAITFAGGAVLGPSVVTRGVSIDYLRPARGAALRAIATVVDRTARQALCRCEVLAVADDGSERLVAAAQGTVNLVELGGR
jgi:uncharacterized protein (TIGR00369 family)